MAHQGTRAGPTVAELRAVNEQLLIAGLREQELAADLRAVNEQLLIAGLREHDLIATLAAERTQLAIILETMGDAVLVVDDAGMPVLTNAAYTEMLSGTSLVLEDEHGAPLPPREWPRQRIARGEAFNMQFAVTAADGARRWFEAQGHPIRGRGSACGVVVIRDITEPSRQRRLQDNFVTLAGHELRTPLTVVLGYLQMVPSLLRPAPDDERLRAAAAAALRQAQRLVTLINDVLDVTRLETGKLTLAHELVDLVLLVTHAVETAQSIAAGRVIDLVVAPGPLLVVGDAGRLEQVLLNLLTNAIKYAPGTPRIAVRVYRVGAAAMIDVQDSGPGIAPEDQERLFTRFAQVESSLRHSGSGLGLGLFLCRELLTAHGGTISVDSALGEGATFTVSLPLADGGDAPDHPSAGAPAEGSPDDT